MLTTIMLILFIQGVEIQVLPVPGRSPRDAVIRCNILGEYMVNEAKVWTTYACISEEDLKEARATPDKR